MNKNTVLAVVVSVAALCVVWWFTFQKTVDTVVAPPVHLEVKADAPNLPKPPSFVERVLKDNPHISRETAEQYEAERIQTNVAHQEHRIQVLAEKNTSDPEEMIMLEQSLARELQAQFEQLEEKYNIKMQQGPPGFLGAPVTTTVAN